MCAQGHERGLGGGIVGCRGREEGEGGCFVGWGGRGRGVVEGHCGGGEKLRARGGWRGGDVAWEVTAVFVSFWQHEGEPRRSLEEGGLLSETGCQRRWIEWA